MIRHLFLILSFIIGPQALAQQVVGTIVLKISNNKKLIVQINDASKNLVGEGDSVLFEIGEDACEGQIESIDGIQARVNAADCPEWSAIKKGQSVYMSGKHKPVQPAVPLPPPPTSPPAVPSEPQQDKLRSANRWFYLPGASLGLVSTANFSSVNVGDLNTGASANASVTADTNPFLGLSADVGYLPEESWGFLGGVSYDFPRSVNSLQVNTGGTSYTFSGGTSVELSDFVVSANALYRWHWFYLPFGLNYTASTLTGAGFTLTGGIGVQFGTGFQITDSFGLEIWIRENSVKASTAQVGSQMVDYGSGSVSSLLVTARFFLPM